MLFLIGKNVPCRTNPVEIGPLIWHGQWKQGTRRINDEYFFLVKLNCIIDSLDFSGLEEEERAVIKEMRWWTLDEITICDEIFIPRDIRSLLKPIIAKNIPYETLEIDLSTPIS